MFENIRSNITWIILVVAIVYAQIVQRFFNKEKKDKDDAQIVKNNNLVINICYIVAAICILKLLYDIADNTKEFAKEQTKEKEPLPSQKAKFYTDMYRKDEYEYKKNETTKRELEKLMSNKKYIEMLEKKGNNIEEWNWQAREKSQSQFNNENLNEDESDVEYISQISLPSERRY